MLRTFFDTSNGEHLRAVHVSAARLKIWTNPSTDATASTDRGEKKKGWECNGVGKNKRRPLKNGRSPTLPHLNQNKRERVSTQPTDNITHSEQCRQKRNKFESSISTFDFSRRDEKSHKEVFMLICLLSKQIFANPLKIRRSSFSKSACLFLRFTNRMTPNKDHRQSL